MAYTELLINTCEVQEYGEGAADGYGRKAKTWNTKGGMSAEACRLVPIAGVEVTIGAEVVIADYTLFIGDVGIDEQDRVIIGSVTYEVLLVKNRQDAANSHHKECLMRAVR